MSANKGSLKKQAVKGVFWSVLERFSIQGVAFIIQIILARILLPTDYGIVGMLAVFLQIAQVFIDSGFGSALIQKQNCTDRDYSTVFIYNLLISIVIYLIFFFAAPWVGEFYLEPVLIPVMRVLTLILIINALSIIQKNRLIKDVDFKTQTKVSIWSSILSGIVGIVAAYRGLGVWALCIQQILNSVFQFLFLLFYVRWFPKLVFDRDSFFSMFKFGSKLLTASLISAVYKNMYTLVIGKVFSAKELGYFTRAESLVMFPSNNLSQIISRVIYPVFSKIQTEDTKLREAYGLVVKMSSFVIFPLMMGLLIVAEPFIEVVLTEKWIGMTSIMQILCIDWMLDHLCVLNLNILYVKGRTDLVLKLEIVKKTIALIILFSSIPFGLLGMCWGRVLYTIIAVVINTYYTKKLLDYSLLKQLCDFFPYLAGAVAMCIVVYFFTADIDVAIVKLLAGIAIGAVFYIMISFICFKSVLIDVKSVLNNLKENQNV